LYLDCFSGISGDMYLGAMLDLGLDQKAFLEELSKLPLSEYEVEIKKASRGGIRGTDVYVHTHEHHSHRGLKHIYEIIDKSSLKAEVKDRSKKAFLKLAQAEAKIHGKTPDEIHFHEVGAVDSIIDIIGACIMTDMLGVERIYASEVNVGHGRVECAHGILPVPAPATMELLKGVPVYSEGEEGELTTPTGALLLSVFARGFGSMPKGRVLKVGYGLGKKERKSPNVLRAVILKEDGAEPYDDGFDRDEVIVLEANIDDMNPQIFDDVIESLLKKGALDVFLTPIIMKKGRPAIKLTCISPLDKKELLAEAILRETTSLGVRGFDMNRLKLYRQLKTVETPLGEVKVKISRKGDETIRAVPEYEDMKKLAQKNGIPLIKAYEIVRKHI
jgi:uncharacterized protein (TIGR00299 family) protein